MGEVIALLAFIFGALWGTAVLISYLQSDPWKKQIAPDDEPEALLRLQEELDEVRRRLAAVEDQVSFDRQLAPPPTESDPERR